MRPVWRADLPAKVSGAPLPRRAPRIAIARIAMLPVHIKELRVRVKSLWGWCFLVLRDRSEGRGRHREPDAARGTHQEGAEPGAACLGDHGLCQGDEPDGVIAAMAVAATKPGIEPAKGQGTARRQQGLGKAQAMHPVAAVRDDKREDLAFAIGEARHVAVKDVMRVVGNHHLPGIPARQPCIGGCELAACGNARGEAHTKH